MSIRAKLKGSARSWTIRFNAAVASLLPVFEYLHQSLPDVQQVVGENWAKYVIAGTLLVNIVLRFKTDSDLADK